MIGLPGRRRQRGGARLLAHQPAAGVHLDVAHAFGAAEGIVVLPLEPRLAHDRAEPRAGKAVRGQVGLGDLRDVAHQVGHRLAGAERNARRQVRLDQAGDDVHRRPLGGEKQVDAHGARHLRQAGDRLFDSLRATIMRSASSSITTTMYASG